jgi:hypothetical protein
MNNHEYTLTGSLKPTVASFQFQGVFENNTITWDATLTTCGHYYSQMAGEASDRTQFIEIHADPDHSDRFRIHVCLDIPQIDHGAILKTMIMIRQYKGLARGKHSFRACSH